MSTKTTDKLTLKDKLSRLTFEQAGKLLGEQGPRLIQRGGAEEVDIASQVYLAGDLFRLKLPGTGGAPAVVTITMLSESQNRLCWNCTACDAACEHVGAAFALILEDKVALGLAAPPPEREAVRSLSDEAIVTRALQEREERAAEERMVLKSLDPEQPWSDYTLTSRESGKTYRVALRGTERGDSYCSCPDFRKNTLGTCKHILYALQRVRRRFTDQELARPYRQTQLALHLRYGTELELRLLAPEKLSAEATTIVKPLVDRPIAKMRDLVQRLGKLNQLGQDVVVYPDAEEFIQQRLFRERISDRMAAIRADVKKHPLRTELLKVELLPYQLDGIAFAVGAGRAVLADDMGLGKTMQGIGVAELLAREAGIRRVLIVTPASLKSQWRNEIHRFCDRDVQLITGPGAERAGQYANDCFFTICNYEQVLKDILAIEPVKWDLIILDEGQRIKNWETKTSGIIKSLRSQFALVLSGTPLENRLDDLFSVVEFIDDRRLGPAFRFFNQHRILDPDGRVLGFQKLDELRAKLKPVLLRRTRDSVIKDLPPRTTEIIRIAPTDEQFELHQNNARIVQNIVSKAYISEMDMLRLRQALMMCRMSANSTFLVDKQPPGFSTKLSALEELLDRLFDEAGRKVLLFSEWTTMLNLIEPLLKKRGLPFVRLDGSVPQKKRQPLVNEFQTNPDCRLFLTTNAGSTGLNLQAANTVINVDLPWNPAVLEQRVGRAHRMGQKRPVQVFLLITEGTIEERLLGTLSAKKELAIAALDAESTVDTVELRSGLEELKRRLEVLLGAKPDAPLDESVKRQRESEAARLAARENVSAAGGQLLGAAFNFLAQLLPTDAATPATQQLAASVKEKLADCLELDAAGRPKLTITLPNAAALDQLASALASLLSIRKA